MLTMEYTDVVIIGNGPSGIALSFMLSGNHPYYNGGAHSDEFLQRRLEANADVSLVDQDLTELCGGLEGRSPNPVAVLFDAVTHPDTDSAAGADTPALLRWRHRPGAAVPHVVLGTTQPGGAWQLMDHAQMQTLSLGNWMELPNMPFKAWLAHRRKSLEMGDRVAPSCAAGGSERASMRDVQAYYTAYVRDKGLDERFVSGTTVTSVERVLDVQHRVDADSGEQQPCGARHAPRCHMWEVRGYRSAGGGGAGRRGFCYRARRVVLATGAMERPRRLNVPGEGAAYVTHAASSRVVDGAASVLVVGGGLSAADAVLRACRRGAAVVHVFRRSADDPQTTLKGLPPSLYPEYRRVHQLMCGRLTHPAYTAYAQHRVRAFHADGSVLIAGDGGDIVVDVDAAAVLIGGRPDLHFLPYAGHRLRREPERDFDSVSNPLRVDPYSLECIGEAGLYAMGALVGDNFVRFLCGGALAICAHVVRARAHDGEGGVKEEEEAGEGKTETGREEGEGKMETAGTKAKTKRTDMDGGTEDGGVLVENNENDDRQAER